MGVRVSPKFDIPAITYDLPLCLHVDLETKLCVYNNEIKFEYEYNTIVSRIRNKQHALQLENLIVGCN